MKDPTSQAAGPSSLSIGSLVSDHRDPLIEMRQITKVFTSLAGEFLALQGIDARFYQGEFVSVIGKSGSGKSTLVNMITGIDHPSSGSVQVKDTFIHTLPESQMAIWRGKNLGIVFQFFQLLPMLTVLENTMLPMDFCNIIPPTERETRAMDLLKRLNLEKFASSLPTEISGGQQQTAAIARALANDPPILIADEPTGNLDSHTADTVFQIFEELVERGKTIIMVTHDNSLARRTTRSLLLFDGELIDPSIVTTFPQMPHRQMLWLTHHLKACSVQPGEVLAGENCPPEGLYLVRNGALIIQQQPTGKVERRIATGEFITGLQLRSTLSQSFVLQGMPESVSDILVLDQATLVQWQTESDWARTFFSQDSAWPPSGNSNGHHPLGGTDAPSSLA